MALKILFDGVKIILTSLSKKNKSNSQGNDDYTECIIAIHNAILRTETHLKKKGYTANHKLTELWHDALRKSRKAKVKDVEEFLFHKADFWSDPNSWLDEPSTLELLPTLSHLREQCKTLMSEV